MTTYSSTQHPTHQKNKQTNKQLCLFGVQRGVHTAYHVYALTTHDQVEELTSLARTYIPAYSTIDISAPPLQRVLNNNHRISSVMNF